MDTQEKLKARITVQIAKLKDLVSNAEDHSDDSEFFYKLSQNVKWIAQDIDRVYSGYYIAIIDNTHYPIGFMTRSEALEYLENEYKFNNHCVDVTVKAVSKELYDKYSDLIQFNELYKDIEHLKYKLEDTIPDTFINDLKTKIEQLRNDIGFESRWEDAARIRH